MFTFSILHYNRGILEEGDEKVAGLQVGIQRQFWVVHHYKVYVQIKLQSNIITAVKILSNIFFKSCGETGYIYKLNSENIIMINQKTVQGYTNQLFHK